MKFFTFSLIAVLLIQASLAAPKPFFFNTIADISQGIGDRVSGAIDFGNGVATGMANTARNITVGGINIATDIGNGITKGITGWTVNGIHAMEQIFHNVSAAIKDSINRFTNRNIVRVVDQVKAKLADIEKRAHNLILNAEEKLDDAKEKVNDNIQRLQDDLYTWSDGQAQKAEDASEETKKEIDALLDNLQESLLTDAQACADSILEPIESLHNQTKKTVEESFPIIDDIVSKIGVCAGLDQSDTRATSQCAGEVKDKLGALSPLPGQYSKLLSQFNRIALSTLHRTPCVAESMEKILEEKRSVAEQIDELLKKDKENQAEPTEAAAESTTEVPTTEQPTESTTEVPTTEQPAEVPTEAPITEQSVE